MPRYCFNHSGIPVHFRLTCSSHQWCGYFPRLSMAQATGSHCYKLWSFNNEIHPWWCLDYVTCRCSFPSWGSLTQQVKRFIQTQSASAFYHRAITTPQPPSTPPPLTHQIPVVASLLQKYTFIFQPPTLLPPPRQITHQIHLLPNTNLVSIRPYWYPHFQKAEIEK